MQKSKKVLSVLMVLVIVMFSLSTVAFGTTVEQGGISVGDTITLGTYDGNPIEWVCVLIDKNGPLMLSKDVICTKEYDAPGENSKYHTDWWGYIRKDRGSNCWQDSNIRQWLNTSGKVNYTHCPPSYAEELGFMSNFTNSELSYVKSVEHTVTLVKSDSERAGYCDGGSSDLVRDNVFSSTFNVNNFYHKKLTDRFMLLDSEQINMIYFSNPDYLKYPTKYLTANVSGNNYASFELVNVFAPNSTKLEDDWAINSSGIRPAFYLNISNDDTTLPLFEIELSYDKTISITLNETNGEPYYQIKITAKIINTGMYEAKNVKAKIALPYNISLSNGDTIEKDIGNIDGLSSPQNYSIVSWQVEGKIPSSDKQYQYSVVAGGDNTLSIEKFQTMVLTPDIAYNKKINKFDMWGFPHNDVGNYNLREDYKKYLLDNVDSNEKQRLKAKIEEMQNGTWGGSCHGMSTAAILFKTANLTPYYWSKEHNKNSVNELNVDETRDLINYCHFLQYTNKSINKMADFNNKITSEKLQILKDLTYKVKDGGTPVLLAFDWKKLKCENGTLVKEPVGHTIIAYDVEASETSNNSLPWIYGNKKYNTRIVTYDINSGQGFTENVPIERMYLYISEDGKDWTIPFYMDEEQSYITNSNNILLVTNDIDFINQYNIEDKDYTKGSERLKYAVLSATFTRNTALVISNGKQKSQVQDDDVTGDLNVVTWYDFNDYELSSSYNKFYVNYAMEDISSPYNISTVDGSEDIELTMSYENCGYMVQSEKLLNTEFIPEKGVTVKNDGGATKVRMTLNDGYYDLPWYTVVVNSNDSKDVSLKKAKYGILVTSDNLHNVTVTANNDTETKEINLNTSEKTVLISEKNKELVALADKDNDGVYETELTNEELQIEDLKVENATLSPEFKPDIYNYTSNVDNSVGTISLTPVLKSNTIATISVNGSSPVNFEDTYNVNLNDGENTIKIVVSNDTGNESTYIITVTKGNNNNSENIPPTNCTNITHTLLIILLISTTVFILSVLVKKKSE